MNNPREQLSSISASELPDPLFRRRFQALVGLDEVVELLSTQLSALFQPAEFKRWSSQHRLDPSLIELITRRAPLFIVAGDVGTGKTEVCETIGDYVARSLDISVTLFKMGLGARGSGLVGEMSRLIADGFDEVLRYARSWGDAHRSRAAGILFVDEADALAQSRELAQMHHEDRAGVNALIRGIDDVTRSSAPLAIMMATNRLGSLDPAIRRRAMITVEFSRPSEQQREALFRKYLSHLSDFSSVLPTLVRETGPKQGRNYGFTYSDITQRLITTGILSHFPNGRPTARRVLEMAAVTEPTPPFSAE